MAPLYSFNISVSTHCERKFFAVTYFLKIYQNAECLNICGGYYVANKLNPKANKKKSVTKSQGTPVPSSYCFVSVLYTVMTAYAPQMF